MLNKLNNIKFKYEPILPFDLINIKKHVTYVTKRKGGDRAVAEACLFILSNIFKKNIEKTILNQTW